MNNVNFSPKVDARLILLALMQTQQMWNGDVMGGMVVFPESGQIFLPPIVSVE